MKETPSHGSIWSSYTDFMPTGFLPCVHTWFMIEGRKDEAQTYHSLPRNARAVLRLVALQPWITVPSLVLGSLLGKCEIEIDASLPFLTILV